MKAWLLGTALLVIPAMLVIWCLPKRHDNLPPIVSQVEPVAVATPAPSLSKDGTTWNLRVDYIKKPDRYSDTKRVQAIGGDLSGDRTWNCSEDEAIAEIRSGEHAFFTSRGGRTARVVVAISKSGTPYLRTESDGEEANNLLSLPEMEPAAPAASAESQIASQHEDAVNASWVRAAVKYPEVGKEGTRIYRFVQEKIEVVYRADSTFFQRANWPELIVARLAPQLDTMREPVAEAPKALRQFSPLQMPAPTPSRFLAELRERDRNAAAARDLRRGQANIATQANFSAAADAQRDRARDAAVAADEAASNRDPRVRDLQDQLWETQRQQGGLQIQVR